MPYYTGDYYRGDYYRGDPGLLGTLFRGVKGAVGAVLRGGNPIIGGIRGLVGADQHPNLPAPLGTSTDPRDFLIGSPGSGLNPGVELVGPGSTMNAVSTSGGGPNAAGTAVTVHGGRYAPPWGLTVQGSSAGVSSCGIKGYHLNKSGYFRRTPDGGVAYIEPRSACVRNRRMNPFNPHALRHAAKRAHAFLRMSKKLVGYYQARKPKGRAFIKAGRRKRA